ncbi:hypothetical protein G7070_01205 [Propioniciclava coleopterorum]|uniref:Uncharacterized protein n=1 Tax=Propioniciclava coleopterorum TaxID=2714937 RepID=A0A6G7Y2Z9_9ACTN|nr:hypothetical protein [Propioniciclava coleopterorum]QIK71153.1 hypothetical protein G7070_01205 [Propioniciclava coleopterorum]
MSPSVPVPHSRPRVGVRLDAAGGPLVRRWLLQLGADPVDAAAPGADGLPLAPQHDGVRREDVAAFVHGLRGIERRRAERFDDHGSEQSWPRGSY